MATHIKDAKRVATGAATIVLILLVWELVVDAGIVPNFLLPSPRQVIGALIGDARLVASHAWTTLVEAFLGLAIGVAVGFVAATLIDRFEFVADALDPIIMLSQTIPSVAIAPLLVLWFGYGLTPKILLVVIGTFFPVTVSVVGGFRSVDPDLLDLMRVMGATRSQIFWQVKVPAAAEEFFSGLKISATYAIVGAVVAEWLGGTSGLGVYMTRVRKSFAYDRMFAAIIVIAVCSILLMRAVGVLEYFAMPWKRSRRARRASSSADASEV